MPGRFGFFDEGGAEPVGEGVFCVFVQSARSRAEHQSRDSRSAERCVFGKTAFLRQRQGHPVSRRGQNGTLHPPSPYEERTAAERPFPEPEDRVQNAVDVVQLPDFVRGDILRLHRPGRSGFDRGGQQEQEKKRNNIFHPICFFQVPDVSFNTGPVFPGGKSVLRPTWKI